MVPSSISGDTPYDPRIVCFENGTFWAHRVAIDVVVIESRKRLSTPVALTWAGDYYKGPLYVHRTKPLVVIL